MIPMITWELRRHRMATIWWGIGVAALIGLTVLSYGSVRDQADTLNKAFGSLSGSIGSFVGSSDMFSPVGYLNSQLFFITLPILFIILSVTMASGFLGKEETSHTLELLLARPISRTKLLVSKLIARSLIVLLVGTAAAIVTIICSGAAGIGISVHNLLLATYGCIFFAGGFGMIAFMMLAASIHSRHVALAAAVTFALGSYLLSSLAGLVDWLKVPAKLLPYHYYTPDQLLAGHVSTGFGLYTLGIYVVAITVSIVGFRRRDIE